MRYLKGSWAGLVVALAITLTAGESCAFISESLTKSWGELTALLDETAVLRDKKDRLPEKSFLGADRQKTASKIQKRLIEARSILLSADSLELLDRADEIKERLPKLLQEIAECKSRKVGAPQKSYNPFTKTLKDLDKDIAEKEAHVERLNAELADIRGRIAEELRSWGMNLNEKQTEVLFASVVGDDLIRNAVIFQNIRDVTEQLAVLMGSASGDTTAARKYYGMYITLIDVLLDSQEDFIVKIDKEWQPQVRKISEGASASLKEAKAALSRKDFTEHQRAVFRSNMASNELTVKAAAQYSRLLSQQKISVEKCVARVRRDREVAVNTYKTVQHISEMNSVLKEGLQLFDILSAMQLPQIQIFDDTGIRKEFDQITRRLQNQ